jgi:hypothetical protein
MYAYFYLKDASFYLKDALRLCWGVENHQQICSYLTEKMHTAVYAAQMAIWGYSLFVRCK